MKLSERLQAASIVGIRMAESAVRIAVHQLMRTAWEAQPQGGQIADQYREACEILEALAEGIREAREARDAKEAT